MDVPLLLSKAQMRRIEPFFPLSHGIPRVDDRRIVSGIISSIENLRIVYSSSNDLFKKIIFLIT